MPKTWWLLCDSGRVWTMEEDKWDLQPGIRIYQIPWPSYSKGRFYCFWTCRLWWRTYCCCSRGGETPCWKVGRVTTYSHSTYVRDTWYWWRQTYIICRSSRLGGRRFPWRKLGRGNAMCTRSSSIGTGSQRRILTARWIRKFRDSMRIRHEVSMNFID